MHTQVYITDKSGQKYWNTNVSVTYKQHEIKNLQRHLTAANQHPEHYAFLDLATARIVDESAIECDMTADELLAALEA